MKDLTKLCFNCMGVKGDAAVCPVCGASEPPVQRRPLLPLGSMLSERYYVGRAYKMNSEGATYLAYDTKEETPVSVREFFPMSLAVRSDDAIGVIPAPGSEDEYHDCLSSFVELWKKLQRLRGLTAMISVTDVFAADNTAYAVFSETEERTLRDYLLSTDQGYIEWDQARYLFMPVLSTLGTLHTSGVIHKGIHPGAFLLTPDGRLKLTDFSIHQARLAYSDLESDIVEGYAPLEIYNEDRQIGPWTDVYSFCAVLYRSLIGATPIAAKERAENDRMMIPAKFAEKLPPYVINSLINGMQIEDKDRTRNVEQLRANLSASPRAVSASAGNLYRRNTVDDRARVAPSGVAPGAKKKPAPSVAVPVADLPSHQIMNGGRMSLIDGLTDDDGNPEAYTPGGTIAPATRQEADPEAAWQRQRQKEKTRKGLIALLVVLILVLIAGVVLLASALFGGNAPGQNTPADDTPTSETQQQIITLPNFVGTLYDQIAHDNYYSQILHLVRVEEYSATVPIGQILSQSIPANTPVPRGTEIQLRVSVGPRTVTIPDLTNQTYEQAVAILATQFGMECVRGTKYNDGTHAPNTVVETLPPVNTVVSQGERVQIIVWDAIQTPATTLPTETTLPGVTDATENTTAPETTAPTE